MDTTIKRALLSVTDKFGLASFARALSDMGVELLSTGGTRKVLEAEGIPVKDLAEYTGFPEMMDGRVKTLHPKVHGGLLALRDHEGHRASMLEHGIEGIDLVCVNLYAFETTISKAGVTRAEAVENIDIGGPSMVRSAAKNHRFVTVVTDPEDYGQVLDELMKSEGTVSLALRRSLAAKAFALTARYDAAISTWLFEQECADGATEERFPTSHALAGTRVMDLRYGENPHQRAAFFKSGDGMEPSVAQAELLSGKALSYNNLVDLDAALALAKEFDEPFVAVTKHNNPCGAAVGKSVSEALARAWSGDPLSAFGSVLAFTRPVDLASAEFLVSENRFVEAIIAPSFDSDALDLLTGKPKWGKSVRLLASGPFNPGDRRAVDVELKRIVGGFLLQERDLDAAGASDCKVVTERAPSPQELEDLVFANRVCKHVKSNAIVLAGEGQVYGVGAGQMSRVDAVKLACAKAGERAKGAVLASDAFFPFPDGVEAALEVGVTAILQPGGSVRDGAVTDAVNGLRGAMVFTGKRHFRH